MLAGIDADDQGGPVAASINSGVPELHRFARTIPTWRTEFLAYFVAGRSPTET
jgi:hypothetical protein